MSIIIKNIKVVVIDDTEIVRQIKSTKTNTERRKIIRRFLYDNYSGKVLVKTIQTIIFLNG